MKGIVLSKNSKEYKEFLTKHKLSKQEYHSILTFDDIYGFKDTILFLTGAWFLAYDERFEGYIKEHNIDIMELK